MRGWACVDRGARARPTHRTLTPSTHPPSLSNPSFLQDPTVHPRWTGDDSTNASEDGRLARFSRKFEGGLGEGVGGGKAALS